jgi:hypothetical protein
MAVPFCLLINRVNFLRDRNITTRGLSASRAELCEILAIRCLRRWGANTLDLAVVLTTEWQIFAGADEIVMSKVEEEELDDVNAESRVGNTIEMAILGDAKRFIKAAACQKIISTSDDNLVYVLHLDPPGVDGIWSGQIIYQPEGSHSILSDVSPLLPRNRARWIVLHDVFL